MVGSPPIEFFEDTFFFDTHFVWGDTNVPLSWHHHFSDKISLCNNEKF